MRTWLALLLAVRGGPTQQPWMLGPFTKPAGMNPVITPNPASRFRSPMNDSVVAWEEYATFNPAAVVRDGKVYLLYRAEDASGESQIGGHTSRLGLAESGDGLHFTRRPTPVLYPDTDAQRPNEWPGGVEDPRVVESEDGTYVLTYTQWNRDVPRLAVATSRDLVTWTKHGPAFARAAQGKYLRTESKSGAILCRIEGGRLIATRVNGTYWMYFGVPAVRVATSDNLRDWTPIEDAEGRALAVLSPRPGYFDSWLVEAGPPALLLPQGIVVLYNAGNSRAWGDSTLPERVYTGGQALFDPRNPVKLIARSESPFITPTESYERTGQYAEGTTFVEGLIPFHGRWFLYYGTADSRVGVAVSDAVVPASDSGAIVALEHRVEEAVARRDTAFLAGVYAQSFRFKHSTGLLEDRAAWLAAVARSSYRSRQLDSLDVDVHGDVALSTGRIHVLTESRDPRWRDYTVRYARLYVRRSGRWWLVTHHSTAETPGTP